MLERFLGEDKKTPICWDELGNGAPTIIAFARLCGNAFSETEPAVLEGLLPEAQTILFAARTRGILEIRGTNQAFDAIERLLNVYVEVEPESFLRFVARDSARQTVRFLDGFRQLCFHGLVMHHLFHEFSLTTAGFELADRVQRNRIERLLAFGIDPSRTDL